MSALSRELPTSFRAALEVARNLLSARRDLVEKGLVDPESERIVLEAYRATQTPGFSPALDRVGLYSRLNDRFPPDSAEKVLIWSAARAEGKALQHLIGKQQFLSHDYSVTQAVLIPRPETEILVELAIGRLPGAQLGLEIGLGSGVISVELLSKFPNLRMVASEVSEAARAIGLENARRILGSGAHRLEVRAASGPKDALGAFHGLKADFLISNPPYLAGASEAEREVAENEPHLALFAPDGDPDFFYTEVAKNAKNFLKARAQVFLELAPERAERIRTVFETEGWFAELFPDLTGRTRVLAARK